MSNNGPSTFLDGLLVVQPENARPQDDSSALVFAVMPQRVWNFLSSSGLTATWNPTAKNADGTFGRVDISGSGGGTGVFDLVQIGVNADVAITTVSQNVTVLMRALTGSHAVTLPAGADGQRVTIKDEDGSMVGAIHITITPTGPNAIEGAGSFVMSAGNVGTQGAVAFVYSATLSNWSRV